MPRRSAEGGEMTASDFVPPDFREYVEERARKREKLARRALDGSASMADVRKLVAAWQKASGK
jgi:hypothetical protein